MKRYDTENAMFLLIDNYDSFTYNLVQAFMQLGRTPLVVKNDDPSLPALAGKAELAMVCISPGPGHPAAAGLCLDFLRALPAHVPVLGVCLGHQLLGQFAGARVEVGPEIMHGKQSEITHSGTGLFSGLPERMLAGRYHSLLVRAEDAPETLTVTARCVNSSGGEDVMGLRFRDRPWAGVQFHPESVLTPEGMRLLANFPSALLADRETPVPESRPPRVRTPVQMSAVIEHLAQGRDLAPEEAAEAFARLMDGELSPSQAGALLLGLRAKGETPDEVEEAVKAVLARAVPVPAVSGPAMDIVGTGGDGKYSFNCSTATALTLAGMGYKVLKHGNRSVSSRCGSADVLEQLGIPLDTPPEAVAETLERDRFVFLFAPRYHPAFRHVMPVRRELGVRTLFNILGPLVNPARPTHHLLGVADRERLPLVAAALARAKPEAGVVVHGAGNYDELTPLGEAALIFVNGGASRPARLDPAEYGIAPCAEQELAVEGPEHAAEVLRRVLSGQGAKAVADMLALNLGLALYLFGNGTGNGESPDPDCGYDRRRMREAMSLAFDAVAAGAGRRFCRA
ncbi:MAG: anthranilate phosphoribosyltransferase [Deltaproteobacteria bacterium]|jgi:anthranilate synthase/phosphoribosyltransferase|nr:anthranilate phosphoribosyltransferase [Deltaproteobacteria bacterium]